MKYISTVAALATLALTMTLLLLAFDTSESYAQNNTITESNQSSTTNDTAVWSNQSDSGNVSGFAVRPP